MGRRSDVLLEDKGLFWASILTALLASVFIALGIRTYARIQKICFYGGLLGLAFLFVLLLVNSKTDFISALNTQSQEVLGRVRHYQGTIDAGAAGTDSNVGAFGPLSGVFLLIPFIVFFNLWSNWGATLYREVRGASDFRKNIGAMGARWSNHDPGRDLLLLFAKTFGWDFHNAANNGYWGSRRCSTTSRIRRSSPIRACLALPDGRRVLAVPPRRAAVAGSSAGSGRCSCHRRGSCSRPLRPGAPEESPR